MKKFKYKCETLTCYMCVSIYINKCNMQHLNNGFNKFKTDDSSHVNMLIVQEMCSNSLKHPNIIAKHWVTYVQYILVNVRCNLWVMVLTY
jgi:hypothetical protein